MNVMMDPTLVTLRISTAMLILVMHLDAMGQSAERQSHKCLFTGNLKVIEKQKYCKQFDCQLLSIPLIRVY